MSRPHGRPWLCACADSKESRTLASRYRRRPPATPSGILRGPVCVKDPLTSVTPRHRVDGCEREHLALGSESSAVACNHRPRGSRTWAAFMKRELTAMVDVADPGLCPLVGLPDQSIRQNVSQVSDRVSPQLEIVSAPNPIPRGAPCTEGIDRQPRALRVVSLPQPSLRSCTTADESLVASTNVATMTSPADMNPEDGHRDQVEPGPFRGEDPAAKPSNDGSDPPNHE